MRVVCNSPTEEAIDFFSNLNYLIKYDTFDIDKYIYVGTKPPWKASKLKAAFNDTCQTCAIQMRPNPDDRPPSTKMYIKSIPIDHGSHPYRYGFTIFLGEDTSNSCRVVFDSIFISTLDSIQNFFGVKPLGPQRVDGRQEFKVNAKLINDNIITLTGVSYCLPIAECCPPNIKNKLCNEPFFPTLIADSPDCLAEQIAFMKARAYNAYLDYTDSLKAAFINHYVDSCMQHLEANERFILKYPSRQHQYTLYYYDQAGNLVQTVPPLGVVMLPQQAVDSIIANKLNPTFIREPAHTFCTNYQYNSLNQVIWQKTPDGGITKFWYDELGRLILSQNAKQAIDTLFSYTLYDALGRIREVGEIKKNSLAVWNGLPYAYSTHLTFVGTSISRKQVTQTEYDFASTPVPSPNGHFTQHYLRSRVSGVTYKRAYSDNIRHATYYDYDLHGNVQSLLQYNQSLEDLGEEYKQIDYTYDLVSGKVNSVAYQHNEPDAFYHYYVYDAENRITEVYTSRDSVIWDEDADYKYYLHGPLARTELQPQRHLQGMDYVYTIQGWIKSVNSNQLKGMRDPGMDGVPKGTNSWANDVMGYSLSYFDSDYVAVNTSINWANSPVAGMTGSALAGATYNLYNGNIRSMTTVISKFMDAANKPLGMAYKYDQLNRLIEANAFDNFDTTNNKWAVSGSAKLAYHNRFTYDANGNILTQVRHGSSATVPMDSLNYHYASTDNKLTYVDDVVSSGNYAEDIDDQSTGNYDYDAIGNLIHDNAEEIEEIKWTVYGKISDIIRTSGSTKPSLAFEYGPDGNRVIKIVKPKDDNLPWVYTYYVRDASGNVMATYNRKSDKKIQYDLITFSEVNDTLRNDLGDAEWRELMMEYGDIGSSTFQEDYVNTLLDNSLGVDLLSHFDISNTWFLANSLLTSSVLDQYGIDELTTITYSTYEDDFLDYLCATYTTTFIEACYADDRDAYLTYFYNNHYTDFISVYTAIFGIPPGGYGLPDFINDFKTQANSTIASNIYALFSCAYNTETVLANNNQSSILGSFGYESHYRDFLNTLDPTTLAEVLENYDNTILASKIFAAFPLGGSFDWTGFFLSQTDGYEIMLSNYPLWAGYIQDNEHYYSMQDYFLLIKDKWGDTYSNNLLSRFYTASRHFVETYAVTEFDIYGSSRLGVLNEDFLIHQKTFDADYSFITGEFSNIENDIDSTCMVHYNYKKLIRGNKRYEMSNHLGNVLTVISDKRITLCSGGAVIGYEADIVSATDYYPFGMVMPERSYSSPVYRYGFNGSEKDDEVGGEGNYYTTEFRELSSRCGNWWSIDPDFKENESPYLGFNSNPILFSDDDGADPQLGNGMQNNSDTPDDDGPKGKKKSKLKRHRKFLRRHNRGIEGRYGGLPKGLDNIPIPFFKYAHRIENNRLTAGGIANYQRQRGSRLRVRNKTNLPITILHNGQTIIIRRGGVYRDRLRSSILERNSESTIYSVIVPVSARGYVRIDGWNWQRRIDHKHLTTPYHYIKGHAEDLDEISIKDGLISLFRWIQSL
jgi:hypothetical protein